MIKLVSCHHIKKRRRRRTLRWHRRWRRHWQARRCGGRRRCRQPPLMTSTTCEIRRPRRTRTTPRNVQIKWDNYLLNSRKGPTRETEKQDKIPKTNKTQLRRKRHLSVWPFTLLFMVLLGDSLHYLAQNETPAGGQARPQSSLGVGLAAANSDANRLYEDLMMTYNRIVRPVQNESDRVVVRLGLKLSQLMDVEWSDYKLKWDPSEYGGIEDINLPAEQIWLPDIALYNSAEGYFAVSIMTKAKVRFDGHVTWNPPAIFRSSCQIDITYFPFDSQNCHLKFGSWTFGTKLDLRHINDTEGTIERGTDLNVTFNFTLRRKPLFYTVNLILPCIGITFFSFLVFYLPSDSGEKVTLTISILVSLIFFLSVLIETIPSTSLAMPLLGKYLVFTMILITLSVCATVCVLNIHFRTPSTHSMPPWIKRWCMQILPKYLFMSVPQYQSQQANILPEQLIYLHNQAYATQAVSMPIQLQQQQQQQTPANPNQAVNMHQNMAPIGAATAAFSSSSSSAAATALGQPDKQGQPNQAGITTTTTTTTTMGQTNLPHQLSSSAMADDHYHHQQSNSKINMAEPMKNDAVGGSYNNKNHRPKLSSANQQRSSSSRSSGRHPLELQLDANNLATNLNNANAPLAHQQGGLFLPYLQSDTARRLQLQRSRSSERDKSNSDNHPPEASNTNNNNQINCDNDRQPGQSRPQVRSKSVERSTQAINIVDSNKTNDNNNRAPNKKVARQDSSKQPSKLPFWRIFKSPKSTASDKSDATQPVATAAAGTTSNLSHQGRLSMASSTSSALFDPNDEYQHHRHFQARASICSNNLWRIGPTRRCSLAVPANFPTYYKPLAQLQHQHQHLSGQSINTISGCIQGTSNKQPPVHYHVHGEESTQTSSSSTTVQERSAVGTLVSVATSNLVTRPKQAISGVSSSTRLQEREMEPITSGGFIQIGAQMPPPVSAIPPRQQPVNDTNRIYSNHTPAPPPPLPPVDFIGQTPAPAHQYLTQIVQMQQHQKQLQQQRSLGGTQMMEHSFGQHPVGRYVEPAMSRQQSGQSVSLMRPGSHISQHLPMSGQYMTSTRPVGQDEKNLHAAIIQQQRRQTQQVHPSQQVFLAGANGPIQIGQQQHQFGLHGANFANQSMPRSRSTDHRLSNVLNMNSNQMNQPKLSEDQNALLMHQMNQANWGPQLQHNTVGRQVNNQAYQSQKLQRQPTIYSLHSGLSGLQRETNFVPLETQIRQRFSNYQPEQSIDMMRRSRSQSSLNRRANLELSNCEHCDVRRDPHDLSVFYPNSSRTNMMPRPKSEIRGRLNSAGRCQFGDDTQVSRSIRQYDGMLMDKQHCNDCSGQIMVNWRRGTSGADLMTANSSCRCNNTMTGLGGASNVAKINQAHQQISTLNMMKLVNEVEKAIQNAMFIAQHIDNLDEFESVKENWKYIAMVIDRIFLIIFLFACIVGTVAIFSLVPWSIYLTDKPIELRLRLP